MPRHRARGFDVRRVYEDDHDGNGYRVLVDRLWPRGMKKDAAALDEWARDAAPSAELRRWYGHDRSKLEGSCSATARSWHARRRRMRSRACAAWFAGGTSLF
jgi:uncharacterized protein YeaO (DUF488 family)